MPPRAKRGRPRELDLPRDPQCHLLCPARRHSLAAYAHRPAAVADRLSAGSPLGATTACSRPSTTPWSWLIASASDARRARARRSSTARSVKTTESGGPRGYDAGKSEGPQAPRAGRYRRAGAAVFGPSGRHSGSGRRRSSAQRLPPLLPFIQRPSPTAPMTPSALRPPPILRSRSCASTPIRSASSSSRADGWSSASSPGSIATVAWQGCRGHHRFRRRLPLRRLRHAPHPPPRTRLMNSRTDF